MAGGFAYGEATDTIGTRLGLKAGRSGNWAFETVPRGGINNSISPCVEAVQPGPSMAPYLPKEDVKWPPVLPPPVGPPTLDSSLLVAASGNPAGFGQRLPEVLPSPEPLAQALPTANEQLLPDLLISPHMLPRKALPWAGRVGQGKTIQGVGAGSLMTAEAGRGGNESTCMFCLLQHPVGKEVGGLRRLGLPPGCWMRMWAHG